MAIDRVVERERDYREKQAHHGVPLLRIRERAGLDTGRQQLDLTTEDTEDAETFCTSIYVITSQSSQPRHGPTAYNHRGHGGHRNALE
jgi:hypothetical protein